MNKVEKRSARIAEQLGMSHGAAVHRLRKMILFRQLSKYGDNVCVRCNKIIESIDDLSIEHIKPWEGRSVELFWDLNNVAFSHIFCNKLHDNGAAKFRKIGPVGTSWCGGRCKNFLPNEKFNKRSSHWNGLREFCRDCANFYLTQQRIKNGRKKSSNQLPNAEAVEAVDCKPALSQFESDVAV